MGGAFALCTILMIFFMPETAYVRTGVVNLDTTDHTVSSPKSASTWQISDGPAGFS